MTQFKADFPDNEKLFNSSMETVIQLGQSALGDKKIEWMEVDKAMFRFYHSRKDAIASAKKSSTKELIDKVDESGLPKELVTPDSTMLSSSEDLLGYLAGIYLNVDPLFRVPDAEEAEYVTHAVSDQLKRDTNRHGWRNHLFAGMQHAVWYNDGGLHSEIVKTSLRIEAISPYNLITDPSVPVINYDREASFIGFTKNVSILTFKKILKDASKLFYAGEILNKDITAISMFGAVTDSYAESGKYKGKCEIPAFQNTVPDWKNWDPNTGSVSTSQEEKKSILATLAKGALPITIIYRRATLELMGLEKDFIEEDPDGNIFKIVLLGNVPLTIEKLAVHIDKFPIKRTVVYVDSDLESPYSFSARTAPIQDYIEKMYRARMKALRKALREYEIMDEDFIEKDKDGTVRVKSHARSDTPIGLSNVYQRYQFDTSGLQNLLFTLSESSDFASKVLGNNLSMQGGHVPGNRTLAESTRLLSTSESRFNLKALMWHNICIEPLQHMIIQQYASIVGSMTYFDKEEEVHKALTLKEYQMIMDQIELSDGLLPSADLVNPDVVSSLLTFITQTPAVQTEFDLHDLTVKLAKAAGFNGITEIRKPHAPGDKVVDNKEQINTTGATTPEDDAALDPNTQSPEDLNAGASGEETLPAQL